jgi:hypothetical protein
MFTAIVSAFLGLFSQPVAVKPVTTCQWPNTCVEVVQFRPCVWPNTCSTKA